MSKIESVHMMRAVMPISILVKLVDDLSKRLEYSTNGVSLNYLFKGVHRAAQKHNVYLYDFDIGWDGEITSDGFWKDIRNMHGWGYGRVEGNNIKLTEDGKEFAKSLEYEEPVKTAFDKVFSEEDSL